MHGSLRRLSAIVAALLLASGAAWGSGIGTNNHELTEQPKLRELKGSGKVT